MNDIIKLNGKEIRKGYCTVMPCRIHLKYLDETLSKNCTRRELGITEGEAYELIKEHGLSEVSLYSKNVFHAVIDTPELQYILILT